jgi:phage repressor protein C with HTH and peptisase S24 domain
MAAPVLSIDPRQRLSDLVRERGHSLAALSRMLGRNAAYLQQFITRGSPRKLEEDDRRRLAQFFGIAERELGGQDLPPAQPAPTSKGEWVSVPRLALEAAAGAGALGTFEVPFDTLQFSRRWLRDHDLEQASLSMIRVSGDSMEPVLREGDEILVDRTPGPWREGIHVIRIGDALLVKLLQALPPDRVRLVSHNPQYAPVEVARDEVDVVGRVVWKGGRL